MRGIYIVPIDIESSYYVGVKNKVMAQVKAFDSLKCDIDIISKKNIRVKDNSVTLFVNNEVCDLNKYLFAYIRYVPGNLDLFNVIKKVKSKIKNVFVEVPTYPYMNEYDNNIDKLKLFIKDTYITKNLHKYVSYIATTNSIDELWGIKTIKIRNGIDINTLPLVKREKGNKEFNMIGLANLNSWHGYDRIIKALDTYIKNGGKEDMHFYIVGEGKEKANLEKLVSDYNLKDRVHFKGVLRGKELDSLLDNMDIGISSLALHRAGSGHDPIKTKEFLGRGIPVMLGYKDKLVDMSLEYVIKVSEDESDIDLNKVYKKFIDIRFNKEEIRKYASENLSWTKQISKVIDAVS